MNFFFSIAKPSDVSSLDDVLSSELAIKNESSITNELTDNQTMTSIDHITGMKQESQAWKLLAQSWNSIRKN